MASRAEEIASRCLRASLPELRPEAFIPTSDHFREFLSALEWVISELLIENYSWWRREGLDGFELAIARKLAAEEVELIGLCLLVSSQHWTPLHLRLRIARHADEIEWLYCKLGEAGSGDGGMVRAPYGSLRATKLLYSLEGRLESISWAYTVTRGSRKDVGAA
jgi:hypothetical protein